MKLLDIYPKNLVVPIRESLYRTHAELAVNHGVDVEFSAACIEVAKQHRVIRIHKSHIIYLNAIIRYFEFYWESVEPRNELVKLVCDFTPCRYHHVVSFDLMPVLFPALAEPVETINQYLEFAGLIEGQTVIDLGAYSGLSSIIFKGKVGDAGRVIAVEPDPINFRCAEINIEMFRRLAGFEIELLNTAVWVDDAGVDFSADGCMGSSASEYIGIRGESIRVSSITLDQLFELKSINCVDLLKCDIEGAEDKIFINSNCLKFSVKRLVVEIHNPPSGLTSIKLMPQLQELGFQCELVKQYGVDLPLLYAINLNL